MRTNAAFRRTEPSAGQLVSRFPVKDARADEELMTAIAAGDRHAFARLVERHLARTVGLATRLMGSRADGEEIAQEAFSRVWSHAARWRPIGSGGNARFTTWLYRIAVNLAIDRKRRAKTTPLDDVEEPLDESDDGFVQIHKRQISDAVAAAMLRLPDRQRIALSLCFFDEVSNIEAGKIMGLSVGAIESLLVRARRTLRQDLSGVYDELSEG
jgi:RNA polymerase sigma-70 factor (ECF subfamily)